MSKSKVKSNGNTKIKSSYEGKVKTGGSSAQNSGISRASLEVSLDNADTVIEGAPGLAPFETWEPSPSFQRSGYLLTIVIPNFPMFVIPSEARNLQLSGNRKNAAGLLPSVPVLGRAALPALR
jgi:hypothetical protein